MDMTIWPWTVVHAMQHAEQRSQRLWGGDLATEFQRQVFGQTLRRALEEADLSQRALARAVGVTHNAVSQWVLGKASPKPYTVAKLESILDSQEGTLGRLLGYVPAGVDDKALVSVIEAIEADPGLGERERKLLAAMYRELKRQYRAEQQGGSPRPRAKQAQHSP